MKASCAKRSIAQKRKTKNSEMLAHKEELSTDVIQRQTSYGAKLDEFYRVIPPSFRTSFL